MDKRLHEQVGKHLDAIADAIGWFVAVVYGLAATVVAWLLW